MNLGFGRPLLELTRRMLLLANTPHGRGHITGYVKHFCSFYVDITGDNP